MSRLSIMDLLRPSGRRSAPARSFDLGPVGRNHGVYIDGNVHERTATLSVSASLSEVLSRIQSYARDALSEWRKANEVVSVARPAVTVVYDYKYSESFQLKPYTFRARWNAHGEAQKTGRRSLVKNIPYEVQLRLRIEQQSRNSVGVEALITEEIDPKGKLAEYAIGRHFLAPSVIHTERWLDDLISALQSHA